ncbi:MAG: glutamine--fructose-6-phosphate transaminase (isomerizing) [Patescibacteria group bacterium]
MCGIFGYLGKRRAAPVLLQGIKDLEYRGYDSAGMAVLSDSGRVICERAVGPVVYLEKKIKKNKAINGELTAGLVHSRWATHGGVTEKNAHPHSDCSKNIWLAHNGIIENYEELKKDLILKGHKFKSQTDTEVIAHLVEEIKKSQDLSLEEAMRLALKEVKGTYGIVAFDKREVGKLVVARNFSPLVLGLGKDELFVASDATPIATHTRRLVYLKDGEMAVLKRDGYKIFNLANKEINRRHLDIDWSYEQAQKGEFKDFTLKEIFEQPTALENSCRGRIDLKNKKAVLGGLAGLEKELAKAKRLIIVGSGTAHHAGMLGKIFIEELAGFPVVTDIASEWHYKRQIFQKGDVLLAISQSGETADTLGALRDAKKKKILTLGITNVIGSTLARETNAGVYQHIGPEIGVAATKSFISQSAVLLQMAVFFGKQRGLTDTEAHRILKAFRDLPKLIEKILTQSEKIKQLADKYKKFDDFMFLGRKYNFPTALEGALKLKEISYAHAEGLAAGELKHGPIAMIDKDFPSVFIAPKDSIYEKNFSNIKEIKARDGVILAVTTEGNTDLERVVDDVIYIPETLEMLYPFLAVIPLQLFGYWNAVLRGYNVDKPRNLAKSVTVE